MTSNTHHINGRVIVTYGRSLSALAIAQSLGRRGAEIIGCDDVDMTVLSFSKYVKANYVYHCPHKHEEKFINDLIEIIKKNKPKDERPYILMPSFNETQIIARHEHRFNNLIQLAVPDNAAILKINTKDSFAKIAKEYDVSSPKTWLPETFEDLRNDLSTDNFPVFIKPADGAGGRGISKVDNLTELEKCYKKLEKDYPDQTIIVQQACEGTDYCFCGIYDHGRYITGMVYVNKQKFPNESGPGVVRETIKTEPFDKLAAELMEPLQWHGVVEIDFLWNGKDDTTPQMIEVNPRFWSGLDHSIRSDVDFPYMLYELMVNGHVDHEDKPHIGHKTNLPGVSNLARIESLFSNAINFEELETQWPTIKKNLKMNEFGAAYDLFSDALKNSLTFGDSYKAFKLMVAEAKEAEKITPSDDDPFVGLGALFILGSLIRHGTLPPEITR